MNAVKVAKKTWMDMRYSNLEKEEIKNFQLLIQMKYPNICINASDYYQLSEVPDIKKNYYPIRYNRGLSYYKMGWFNNGATTIWCDHQMERGTVKFALREPKSQLEGWTEVMTFKNDEEVIKIIKYMKMKAFW
jgi:hypothetical protein